MLIVICLENGDYSDQAYHVSFLQSILIWFEIIEDRLVAEENIHRGRN